MDTPRRVLLVLASITAMGAGLPPREASAQIFTAVVVHGSGIPEPILVEDPDEARCFWFFTYNFIGSRHAEPPRQEEHEVTFSFLTEEERKNSQGKRAPQTEAGFHTRLQLRQDRPPYVKFQKPKDDSFVDRMGMHAAAEAYFSSRGIPTRLDLNGAPGVKVLSSEEAAGATAELVRQLGAALPACAQLRNPPTGRS